MYTLIHYRNLKRLILVEISFEEIKCYEICLLCVDTKLIHVALKNIFRIIKKKKKTPKGQNVICYKHLKKKYKRKITSPFFIDIKIFKYNSTMEQNC